MLPFTNAQVCFLPLLLFGVKAGADLFLIEQNAAVMLSTMLQDMG